MSSTEKYNPAQVINRETGASLTVMFNPKELSVDKSVSWTPKEGSESDVPVVEFGKPSPANLSVTLHFDTFEKNEDVYGKYVQQLESYALVDSEKKRPPLCAFAWSNFVFTGVITSLGVKYTKFGDDGKRVRAEVALKMMAASEATKGKTGGAGGGGSAGGSSSAGAGGAGTSR